MSPRSLPIIPLSKLEDQQEADMFALLSAKQAAVTRSNKPYWKVAFRDAHREVAFPIWGDSPWAEACAHEWEVGQIYKLRAVYQETQFGPQLELRRVRLATDDDRADGYDPQLCSPRSRFDPDEMFAELLELVTTHVADPALRTLLLGLLEEHRELLKAMPAARRNHHAFLAGLLEHMLNVIRTCVYLAEKYIALYPDMRPPLDPGLVVAGAVLHDIGKLREYNLGPEGASSSPSGSLLGHILQGRDMLREAALRWPIDDETLLRLEHVIISHHRLAEYGSPKPPMTPEALLVHYADDIDAKMQMFYRILQDDPLAGPVTGSRNVLGHAVFRGWSELD